MSLYWLNDNSAIKIPDFLSKWRGSKTNAIEFKWLKKWDNTNSTVYDSVLHGVVAENRKLSALSLWQWLGLPLTTPNGEVFRAPG